VIWVPGWEWKPHEAGFNYGVTQLKKYLEKHLFAELTRAYVSEDGFKLGLWISNLRQKNKTKSKALTKSQNAKLREIEPLIFEIKTNANFIDGCEAFKAFVKREGHSSIPRTHIENGVSLQIWVGNRRQDFKKNRLSKAEIKTLEALPNWSWHKFDAAWERAFLKLISFTNENGHADVPVAHIQDGFKLGRWVNGQRTRYASKTLQTERARKLENVKGWTWKSQRSGRSKKA